MSSEHPEEVVVPLSEHEQRMLDEIESALYAEDPKFASSVRKTRPTGAARPTGLVVLLGVLGLALLIGGLVLTLNTGWFPFVSLIGFLVMFGAGVLAMRSAPQGAARPRGGTRQGGRASGPGRGGGRSGDGQSYSSRMEDRFRRRFEQ